MQTTLREAPRAWAYVPESFVVFVLSAGPRDDWR